MTTFLLVHGSWHGGWCWSRVRRHLEGRGHTVLAPDLPGHGDDRTPIEAVTLSSYAERIVDVIDQKVEPGDGLVLVGHSMGGIVISEVAERVPDRVDLLVYLAAALLPDGEAMLDLSFADAGSLVARHLVLEPGGLAVTLDPAGIVDCFYADCDPLDAVWATTRLVPEAIAPLTEAVRVSPSRWGRVRRAYIVCEDDRAISPAVQRRQCEEVGVDLAVTMASAHSPFLSDAPALAGVLVHLAAGLGA